MFLSLVSLIALGCPSPTRMAVLLSGFIYSVEDGDEGTAISGWIVQRTSFLGTKFAFCRLTRRSIVSLGILTVDRCLIACCALCGSTSLPMASRAHEGARHSRPLRSAPSPWILPNRATKELFQTMIGTSTCLLLHSLILETEVVLSGGGLINGTSS